MNVASPSLTWTPPAHNPPKRQRDATLESLWGCKLAKPQIVVSKATPEYTDENQLLVVDLFSGCGGFSCGAGQAGHRVVLAVDCDSIAL
eukprot:2744399-Prymnesium_polylepis.1